MHACKHASYRRKSRPLLTARTHVLRGVYPAALWHCAVGFSGVVFGLIVVDNALSAAPNRSIMGLFTVGRSLLFGSSEPHAYS